MQRLFKEMSPNVTAEFKTFSEGRLKDETEIEQIFYYCTSKYLVRLLTEICCCPLYKLANMILPEEENFLLIFRREAPLDNSVDFMKVRMQTFR